MKKQLTIKDIASISGVSKTTVSFVLNGKGNVSEKTRKRVLKVIEDSDYKPTLNSRRLVYKKSYTIAVVFDRLAPVFDNLFYFGVMNALMKRCADYGYALVYSHYTIDENGVTLPENIIQRDVDGMVFLKDIPPELNDELIKLEIPYVIADAHDDSQNLCSVRADYSLAAQAAVEHLVKCNHKKIGFIGSIEIPRFFEQMFEGFKRGNKDADLQRDVICVNDSDDWDNTAADRVKNGVTAFFCMQDTLAIELIRRLKKHGVRVPEDVSVIAIDDIPVSEYITPALTTVAVDMELMGIQSIELLMQRMENKDAQAVILPPCKLIVRDSVKKI